ncbi:MAG: PH domain-containing protein [Nanoarchaeota archaeon]|nr:PH domain-containing protein [Nanoarchaeota archaeon]
MVVDKVLFKHSPDDKVVYPWLIGKGGAILVGGLVFVVIIFTSLISLSGLIGGLFNLFLIVLFVGAIVLMVYYDFLRKTYAYVITSKGVHFKGGIFWKFDKFVSFNKITNISSEQGVVEQLVKISHVNIHTAGQLSGSRGMPVPEITIEGLPQDKSSNILDLLRKNISK